MATTLLDLYSGQPGIAATTLYTCPSNTKVRIVAATATNDTTTAKYFTVYRVPSGGSAGDDNLVINQKTLSSRESYTCPELVGHIIEAGDTIEALAEAASQITIHLSGVAIT